MKRTPLVLGSVLLLASLIAVARSAAADCATPIVETSGGQACGRMAKGGLPGDPPKPVLAYLGLPYAAPPTLALRWAAPEPAAKWDGVRDATRFGPVCPQTPTPKAGIEMSEDCLSLNVWTPDVKASLPVMVFLHGGSFVVGGSAAPVYDGANLAGAGPVVMVTLNYRLGALGFLAGIEGLGGNYGLLDQQLALTWVRGNIRAFGGDPTKVTLFGESAGAMSVGILSTTPSSKGLFRAAIMESNPYGLPYKTVGQAESFARALQARLGCDSAVDPVACMRALPANRIVAEQEKTPALSSILLGLAAFLPWSPVVGSAPLTAQPNRAVLDLPAVLGTNLDEGQLFIGLQERSSGPIDETKFDLETDVFFGSDASRVREQYHPRTGDWAESLAAIAGDYLFTCANRHMLGRARSRVFGYQFTQVPSFPTWPGIKICDPAKGEVCHAAELPFVFGNPIAPTFGAEPRQFSASESKLSRTMMSYWTQFATNLTPTAPNALDWSPFTSGDPDQLILNDDLSTDEDVDAHCSFWNLIGYDRPGPLGHLL